MSLHAMRRDGRVLGAFADTERRHYLGLVDGVVTDIHVPHTGESMAVEFPLLAIDEREMQDRYAVPLHDLPNDPMVEGRGLTTFVVGPVHAGIIEPGRFTFHSGGETIVHLEAQFGFSHRGVEKFLEGRDAGESAWHVARICAACSVARSWSYARALESLCGVTIDDASELARVICAELERAYNHTFDLGVAAAGAGYGFGLTRALELKERFAQINLRAFGHRYLFDAVVPGGVRSDCLVDRQAIRTDLRALRGDVEKFAEGLFDHHELMSRFSRAGILPHETALAFGAVGPTGRASGGTFDVRCDAPYGAYSVVVPHRATANDGDAAARVRVKYDELLDSFRLIDGALELLAKRKIGMPQPMTVPSGEKTTLTEGPRGAEIVSVRIDALGRVQRFHLISASYRNWPLVTRAMEANIVPDFPLVNKSFNLCYACGDR